MHENDLPSYRDQSDEVRARFARIRERETILEVRHLGKRYRSAQGEVDALRDINFSVHRREFVCVIGPSGCGKSTLARILAGLDSHTSGEALLDGKAITGPGPDRGMVFQGYSLFPWLTVKKNVMFGPQMKGAGTDGAARDAAMWLELVGLEKFADAYPHQLSGGMRQRVAIARALVNQPRILLMDEPFGALDEITRHKLDAELLALWRQQGLTVVFVTHSIYEAVYLSTRVRVMAAHPGRLVDELRIDEAFPRAPQFRVSTAFARYAQQLQHSLLRASGAAHDGAAA